MSETKYSRQREAILFYLRSTTSHPTAEKIYRTIQKEFPKISLGTIYRNLNLLSEKGEILRFDCGDGVEHFDATTEPHNHFICRKCRCVLDLEMNSLEEIDQEAEKKFTGEIEGHVIYFYGICGKCLKK
jgi:Fur family peroxide stress response transcriptional regulator